MRIKHLKLFYHCFRLRNRKYCKFFYLCENKKKKNVILLASRNYSIGYITDIEDLNIIFL